ncbi:MAG: GNAT family N-acetyltransferase [Syntrophales bacterium]|nr:GNAT family N-acetyltransferase [Syntrophales bacterium]
MAEWENRIAPPEAALEKIDPGMSIFLSTGMAEPRTLVRNLMLSKQGNLQDLEIIQLISLGDTVPADERFSRKYRLKTFFSGWIAGRAVMEGRVDLIPSRFSRIPWLFETGMVAIDAAFVQITPPDRSGWCSLGVGVDVARHAIERASLVVGEINEHLPRTLGDTLVHVNDFHLLVRATEPPIYIPRWPVGDIYRKLAANTASVVEDGSCIAFSIGPLYEALAEPLSQKRNLGIHTPFFTDALMDIVKSGAVSNRRKGFFRGKSLTSYALGTADLLTWLDRNPLIEFQPIDVVLDPQRTGLNERFIGILPARKADLTGGIALQPGKGDVTAGPGAVQEVFAGAALSRGGRTVFALPSRNRRDEPNIVLSVSELPYQFSNPESLDMIVTEYGVAYMMGRTVRERAQALIDIAHPDDREELVVKAKQSGILYRDQIYIPQSGHLYPEELACTHVFQGGLTVRFRPIRPSDEDEMRRLFYRFSDRAVYYRYFSHIKTMPHARMQEYVNVDYSGTLSIVGLVEDSENERIIAEGRYVLTKGSTLADVAFVVDEAYQGRGIASFLLKLLYQAARKRGVRGFTADILADNHSMLAVMNKLSLPVRTRLSGEAYELKIMFDGEMAEAERLRS